ncbi:MAG: DoxX family protein [Chlorobi bacterium]|nr:DoxX family protein [Chlorobiota bacterium]MCI0715150.1 DoxX family protein [Chlorobiota bacterium]
MSKSKKIVYWIATIWLALGMVSTGGVQLFRLQTDVDLMTRLGYPLYLLTILGVWKILGVAAVLIPKFPLLKEWAYAGFFFAMSGAIISHIASGSPVSEMFGPSLLLILTLVSRYFSKGVLWTVPADRKIVPA